VEDVGKIIKKKIISIGVVRFIVINMTPSKKYIGVVGKEIKMQQGVNVKNIKHNKKFTKVH